MWATPLHQRDQLPVQENVPTRKQLRYTHKHLYFELQNENLEVSSIHMLFVVVLFCSPGCLGTHSIDQDVLELPEIYLPSASRVLGLRA